MTQQLFIYVGIYPNDLKLISPQKSVDWKQPTCPLTGKCINKLVHPDNGILASDKKKQVIKTQKDMDES